MVDSDQRLWWPESTGIYSVRSAYKLLMNRVLDNNNLYVEGNWRVLWKLKLPPKVKHFLWRLCRISFLHGPIWRTDIDIQYSRPWCSGHSETLKHLFVFCSKVVACWNAIGIFYVASSCTAEHDRLSDMLFSVLAVLSASDGAAWCMTLWSLW